MPVQHVNSPLLDNNDEVVVDNFAEARQRDVLNLAEEMEDNLDKDTRLLEEPCLQMVFGSGFRGFWSAIFVTESCRFHPVAWNIHFPTH